MYQIVKDGMAFHVNDEEQARQYLLDGCSVYEISEMRVNEDGDLEREEHSAVTGSTGSWESDEPIFG